MMTDIEITDAMVDRAYEAYYTRGRLTCREAMRLVLEAALNPPIVLCKNCGKGLSRHALVTVWGTGFRACPGAVWDPAS